MQYPAPVGAQSLYFQAGVAGAQVLARHLRELPPAGGRRSWCSSIATMRSVRPAAQALKRYWPAATSRSSTARCRRSNRGARRRAVASRAGFGQICGCAAPTRSPGCAAATGASDVRLGRLAGFAEGRAGVLAALRGRWSTPRAGPQAHWRLRTLRWAAVARDRAGRRGDAVPAAFTACRYWRGAGRGIDRDAHARVLLRARLALLAPGSQRRASARCSRRPRRPRPPARWRSRNTPRSAAPLTCACQQAHATEGRDAVIAVPAARRRARPAHRRLRGGAHIVGFDVMSCAPVARTAWIVPTRDSEEQRHDTDRHRHGCRHAPAHPPPLSRPCPRPAAASASAAGACRPRAPRGRPRLRRSTADYPLPGAVLVRDDGVTCRWPATTERRPAGDAELCSPPARRSAPFTSQVSFSRRRCLRGQLQHRAHGVDPTIRERHASAAARVREALRRRGRSGSTYTGSSATSVAAAEGLRHLPRRQR